MNFVDSADLHLKNFSQAQTVGLACSKSNQQ